MRLRLLTALIVTAAAGLAISGCSSDAPNEQAEKSSVAKMDPTRTRPVRWEVHSFPDSDRVKIISSAGYCENLESPPRYGRIQVVGRADGTYIKAFLLRSKSRLSPRNNACLDVGSSVFRIVAIDRNGYGPKLYDASTDPPTLQGRLP
jgi:hypothetical protein